MNHVSIQAIVDVYNIKVNIYDVLELWNAQHRKYHTETHLQDLLQQIHAYADTNITQKDRDILALAAVFHDIIYDPQRSDNEEQSVKFLMDHVENPLEPEILEVIQIIQDTQHHQPSTPLSRIFSAMDMSIVLAPYPRLLEWEEGIRYEYSHLTTEEYKKARVKFLESMVARYPENAEALLRLIEVVRIAP